MFWTRLRRVMCVAGFADLTNYLIDGNPSNGETAVLGAEEVGSVEGFSSGRTVRLGLRVTF